MAENDPIEPKEPTEPKEPNEPQEPKEPEEEPKDPRGEPGINREKYQRDERIAELEAKIAEAAKTEGRNPRGESFAQGRSARRPGGPDCDSRDAPGTIGGRRNEPQCRKSPVANPRWPSDVGKFRL